MASRFCIMRMYYNISCTSQTCFDVERNTTMQHCATCNRTYPDDAPGFCPQDGTRLTSIAESNTNCQRCGYSISNDAPFCPNCGTQKQVISSQPQQIFQATRSQPQANQQVYGSQPSYLQNPQNPQQPYSVPGQFPQPAPKRKIVVWQIIAAIIFILLGLLQILRGFRVLR